LLARVLLLLLALAFAGAARAAPQKTAHLEVELAPMTASATPGSTVYVAVRHRIEPGWHTYWRNSGDSGGPTRIAWALPDRWKAGEIVWPTPERQRFAHLMNYAYSGEVYLPVPVEVPADAKVGDLARLHAAVSFLVCSDTLCVPEDVELSLTLPVAEGRAALHPDHGRAVADVLARAPKSADVDAAARLENGVLKLAAVGGPLAGGEADGAYFFPYEPKRIVHAAVQTVERGPDGLTLTLAPSPSLKALNGPLEGVLVTRAGAWEIAAEPGPLPAGASGLGRAAPAAEPGEDARAGSLGLPLAALFAFLGGLILNLMPCVFPVLSMKAASLAGSAHAPAEARRDGLAFLAGVVATFLALAGLLVALKAAGQAAGWGFQLQSPRVTGALALLMLAVGLNLSGLYQLGTSLQAAGAAPAKAGPAGAFLTGVLAVVVAAPCTAPFMAAATGYALAAGAVETLVVFTLLALGFALPFVLLSLTPALLRRLPRPGGWMVTLRRVLAFPMYGAAVWMAWVFARQTAPSALALLVGAAVALAFALYLLGLAQSRQARGLSGLAPLGAAGVALTAGAALAAWAAASRPDAPPAQAEAPAAVIPSQAWSPERLVALRAEGRPVLVNFTADWCVTCKVNERAALSSARVKDAFERTGAAYLVADWTRRDDAIARELQAHGRSGVPLYLLYAPGAARPEVLPQLLSEGAVIKALETAAEGE